MEAVVRSGSQVRSVAASGRDIYAVTAPLAVEAVERIVDGRCRTLGATTAGSAIDASDFLATLAPEHLLLG